MKKKDDLQNEVEPIDEVDEVVEDEIDEVVEDEVDEVEVAEDEVVEDEIDDVVEDEVVELSTEKPSKAKGGKKLSKGAKAGIIAGSVVAGLVIIVLLAIYVILPLIFPAANVDASYKGVIGKLKPTAVAENEVTNSMTSYEMMEAAIANYYAAEYAANICNTGVVSTTVGPVRVDQLTHSLKIRKGPATLVTVGEGKNAIETYAGGNAQYFAYSKSYGFANMWEEYKVEDMDDGDGTILYRSATDMSGKGEVSSWSNDSEFYGLAHFIQKKTTDFTQLWSYEVNKKTVDPECLTSKPDYDAEGGFYTFTIKLNIKNEAAIAGYREVMKYQMKSNLGAKSCEIDFKKLEFEFSVWDNGFIRYLKITEAYRVDADLGIALKVDIGNVFMNEYCFDETEKIPYLRNGKDDIKVSIDDSADWFKSVKK